MTSELSVEEMVFLLSKECVNRHNDGRESLTEIPAKVKRLILTLNIENVLP